ncbi:dihydrodipicolinate synthase family protein [Alloscardovia macacae]|uniref:Dihydrodipicolinate synthetase n=1 Tax=Alloscardovia macacae TaxID=1160091 RepID=A0A261F3Q1_9BIFI|nr:dihydrodipicolinate synthase family protein [Alloscardovia macacae]OZG53718.1 dihydrodipicolinate synthetase [Alloscardovia macacae]
MARVMNTDAYKGIIVPIIMPVTDALDGKIDLERLREHVNYEIDHGVDGILAFGSNSEFYMFSDDEMIEATQAIIEEVRGRVPVMFGLGHIRTSQNIQLARRAAELDIDAISVLQPMFITPTQDALYNHFSTIAAAVPDVAVLIYNNPGLAGYPVSLDTIVKLAHDVPNIVGIKDSSGNITNLQELVRRTEDIDFSVFAGKDTIVYAGLCCGADGAVCSTANIFPELICGLYDAFAEGDLEKSRRLQFELNPLRLSQDAASFPSATKAMGNMMGMNMGPSVLPTETPSAAALEGMRQAMVQAGYLSE